MAWKVPLYLDKHQNQMKFWLSKLILCSTRTHIEGPMSFFKLSKKTGCSKLSLCCLSMHEIAHQVEGQQ